MTTYAKRKLKYSRNKNFNLLHYVKWDRIVTLTGAQAEIQSRKFLRKSNLSQIIVIRYICL